MKFLKLAVVLSVSFSALFAFADQGSTHESFSASHNIFTVLTSPVKLSDGRTVTDRLQICENSFKCRVFIIESSDDASGVKDFIADLNQGEAGAFVQVGYDWDENLPHIKIFKSIKSHKFGQNR